MRALHHMCHSNSGELLIVLTSKKALRGLCLATRSVFPLPPRLEQLAQFEQWERMRLGVEDDLIQGEDIVLAKQEVEVLERLCKPEALHIVSEICWYHIDAIDAAETGL